MAFDTGREDRVITFDAPRAGRGIAGSVRRAGRQSELGSVKSTYFPVAVRNTGPRASLTGDGGGGERSGSAVIEEMERQIGEFIVAARKKAAELRTAADKAGAEATSLFALAAALISLAEALQKAAVALRQAADSFDSVAAIFEAVQPVIANARAAIKAAEERADTALEQIEAVTGEAQSLIPKST